MEFPKCKKCGRDTVHERDNLPFVDLGEKLGKRYFCTGCLKWEEFCECEPLEESQA